jgi:hypothetical protein
MLRQVCDRCAPGVHVPLFIKYPRLLRPHSVFTHPVSHVDIFPTLAAQAGSTSRLGAWAHPLQVTSAPGLDAACHICAGTGLTPPTSAPGLRSALPHLRRDWAHPSVNPFRCGARRRRPDPARPRQRVGHRAAAAARRTVLARGRVPGRAERRLEAAPRAAGQRAQLRIDGTMQHSDEQMQL